MERIKKALEKVKRSPVTVDSFFKKFFEMDPERLKCFRASFEEMIAARLTGHLREERGCINMEIEQSGFEDLKALLKGCAGRKIKKKGTTDENI